MTTIHWKRYKIVAQNILYFSRYITQNKMSWLDVNLTLIFAFLFEIFVEIFFWNIQIFLMLIPEIDQRVWQNWWQLTLRRIMFIQCNYKQSGHWIMLLSVCGLFICEASFWSLSNNLTLRSREQADKSSIWSRGLLHSIRLQWMMIFFLFYSNDPTLLTLLEILL